MNGLGGERAQQAAPLIVTLELAEPAQSWCQGLRDRHFPPERNIVPAHVSLFHALPGTELARIEEDLSRRCAALPPLHVTLVAPMPLGHGVALRVQAPGLQSMRTELAALWGEWLTKQDRAAYRPHVTIQNKVDPQTARQLLDRLREGFDPVVTSGVALRLWRYLDGPWEPVARIAFGAPVDA